MWGGLVLCEARIRREIEAFGARCVHKRPGMSRERFQLGSFFFFFLPRQVSYNHDYKCNYWGLLWEPIYKVISPNFQEVAAGLIFVFRTEFVGDLYNPLHVLVFLGFVF